MNIEQQPRGGKAEPSDQAVENLAMANGILKSQEHWGTRYYTNKGTDLFRFARALLSRYSAQPATDAIPRHVAQTLATAIYETAQKLGIAANNDHSALSVPQCLHLLDCMAKPAASVEPVGFDRDALVDLIADHLSGTYHCTRVWEAWSVGTMSEEDFEDVGESETPSELADAIVARFAAPVAAQAQPSGNASDEPEWLQRLRIEARDLSDRLDRLSRFRDTAGFRMLTETDQALLDRQGNQMHALVQTMNQRIHSGAAQHMRSKSHD